MKKCELCRRVATTHCESDRAILCWTCDYRVHSANFLVARHSRTLLCRFCQSPTPWSAAGTMLGAAVSVCSNCIRNTRNSSRGITGCVDNDVEIESDGSSDEVALTSSSSEGLDMEGKRTLPRSPPPLASSSTSSNSDAESFCSPPSASSPSRSRGGRRKTTFRKANQKHTSSSELNNVDIRPGSTAVVAVDCSGGGRDYRRSLKRQRLVNPSRVGVSPTFSSSDGVR